MVLITSRAIAARTNTVNWETFARVLFSRNFAYFGKIKSSRNAEITLSFTDIGKSCHSRVFSVANVYFNAIRENKILVKISGLIVLNGNR